MAVDGTYNVTIKTPMGAQEGVLTLTTDGAALTGNMSGAMGAIDLQDGAVDGDDNVSWKANITTPMPMTLEFSGAVNGDAISGTVKLGAFGESTFEGTRA